MVLEGASGGVPEIEFIFLDAQADEGTEVAVNASTN